MTPVGGSLRDDTCPSLEARDRVGELRMRYVKRWLVVMAVGLTLLVGLANCVVVPATPGPSGYMVSPPTVIVRPYYSYRPQRHYYPYRHYHPYHRHHGW
jgi:hypothetical protein